MATSTRALFGSVLAGLLAVAAVDDDLHPAPAAAPAALAVEDYAVTGIRAHLFYEELGQAGTRDVADLECRLWNTVIGEGRAEAPSNTTLLLVDLEGPAFGSTASGLLLVEARAGKRVVMARAVELSAFFSQTGRLTVPFLAYGTGCEPLDVTATLSIPLLHDRGTHTSLQTIHIPFECGE